MTTMYKKAYSQLVYRQLARRARPYYNYTGPNDWSHIADVRNRARAMVKKLYGRDLTPEEYAAILFHDSTKHEMGAENHGRTGAVRAEEALRTLLSMAETRRAAEAIAVHDDNLARFPSTAAELLASADANPPDVPWMLNKSYNWQLRHGVPDPAAAIIEKMPKKYGTNGTFNYPGIYRQFYGRRVQEMQKAMDEMTPERVMEIVKQYRQQRGLPMDRPA